MQELEFEGDGELNESESEYIFACFSDQADIILFNIAGDVAAEDRPVS